VSKTAEISVPLPSITNQFTVNLRLTGLRAWKTRMSMGLALIKLGVWVTGMGCSIELTDP
jgi:hypothetical protein